jgi:hypothetical protein
LCNFVYFVVKKYMPSSPKYPRRPLPQTQLR